MHVYFLGYKFWYTRDLVAMCFINGIDIYTKAWFLLAFPMCMIFSNHYHSPNYYYPCNFNITILCKAFGYCYSTFI